MASMLEVQQKHRIIAMVWIGAFDVYMSLLKNSFLELSILDGIVCKNSLLLWIAL